LVAGPIGGSIPNPPGPMGQFISKFGIAGNGNTQFNFPTNIASDGVGNLYVVDQSNSRVQKFSSAGAFVQSFSGFSSVSAVTVDSAGYVYIANGGFVNRLTGGGTLIGAWAAVGPGMTISAMATDAFNNVYTLTVDGQLTKFSQTGTQLLQFQINDGTGFSLQPYGLAVAATDGSI